MCIRVIYMRPYSMYNLAVIYLNDMAYIQSEVILYDTLHLVDMYDLLFPCAL